MKLNHFKEILRYEIVKWLVHPQEQHSTGFTTQACLPGISTEADTGTDTETDMDTVWIH